MQTVNPIMAFNQHTLSKKTTAHTTLTPHLHMFNGLYFKINSGICATNQKCFIIPISSTSNDDEVINQERLG